MNILNPTYMAYLKLMRPHQYIKNLFVFMPIFFAAKLTETALFVDATIAFVSFSMIASAIYIFNDYVDIENDKKHPRKKFRPLASGMANKNTAIWLMVFLFMVGTIIMYNLSVSSMCVLVFYAALNILYSLSWKHIAILDVATIATGFVLRLFVGSFATDTMLTVWIVVITFLLALFMALSKRRDDVLLYMDTGKKMRKVVDGYNLQFLDISMAIMASVVIVAYTIYTTSEDIIEKFHSQHLYVTALFVIIGIMRYLQITFVLKSSGSPTKILLNDRFLQLTIIAWVSVFAWILYWAH